MEKKVRTFDVCDKETLPVISEYVCEFCRKDLCKYHTKAIYMDIYGKSEKNPSTLKIGIGRPDWYNVVKIVCCEECATKLSNSFQYIIDGDKITLLKEILSLIREHAKVEEI